VEETLPERLTGSGAQPPFSNQPAHVDALVALEAKRRTPQGKANVAGKVDVGIPLIAHAPV
jgi:hypothetical protein